MKRREFCRQLMIVGGAVVLAPLVKGCAPEANPTPAGHTPLPPTARPASTRTPFPAPTVPPAAMEALDPTATAQPPDPTASPQPSPTTALPAATVALVNTTDRAWGVREALRLLDHNPARGSRVLLKPNYNSADLAPASTHPAVLRALVEEIQGMGARTITVGERSGMGDTRVVLTQTGVFSLGEEMGFDTVVFDELDEPDWVVRQDADYHWQAGYAVPRLLLDSDCVIQTCNLKTHRYGGHFTMSLKNSVGFAAKRVSSGGYNYMTELHNAAYQRQMIAEINTAYSPGLIVVDGVEAFLDGGPAQGTLAAPNVVLAGSDPIAVDAVGVAILRLFGTTPEVSEGKIFDLAQIARAVELGLGIDTPQRINLITGDAASAAYAAQLRPLLV
ncbi:MAG: DUF362 domain-containing protein [Candidatus Promineifilaceae bacterium]